MKKIFAAGVAALLLVGTLVGCTESPNMVSQAQVDGVTDNKDMENVEDTKNQDFKYVTVGEIIAFDEDGIHVLTGDIAQIFKVDKEKMKDFYLGETVGVKAIDNDKFELDRYKKTDFNIRYTNMGDIISTVFGKIKEVNDKEFIVATKDGDIEFELYEGLSLETGTEVTVEYLKREEGNILIDVYNENSKINLIVKNIKREETGMMILDTEDGNGMKYEVYVLGSTILNFNHSDLKANSKITVYPEIIRESYPAQVEAKMIKK